MLRLEEIIIKLSVADTFEKAKLEWYFYGKYSYNTKEGHCVCGFRIKHITFAINKLNGKIVQLGSSCRKKFPNVFIQTKGNKIGKMLRKFYHKQVFEEITDIKEYVEKCMELFCETHFNNIDELSLKECERYIRDIKKLNIPSLINLLKKLEKRVEFIKSQSIDVRSFFTKSSITPDDDGVPYPDDEDAPHFHSTGKFGLRIICKSDGSKIIKNSEYFSPYLIESVLANIERYECIRRENGITFMCEALDRDGYNMSVFEDNIQIR